MFLPVLLFSLMPAISQTPDLKDEQVVSFARLALDSIVREFPNKPGQVYTGPESAVVPRAIHPVFYGSFDWHSSVHGHWMLVRLLKTQPNSSIDAEIRALLHAQLTAEALQVEANYFDEKQNKGFERMYGWAWLLQLANELHTFEDDDAKLWAANLKPLEDQIVGLLLGYLPRLSHPIRTGVHPDTAFAFGMELDYARAVGNQELEKALVAKVLSFYLDDVNYPVQYEPSGEDFFSAGLNEADLMRRVLPQKEYLAWLNAFLPGLVNSEMGNLLTPTQVSDVTDGRLVHLAGLNLSRGWALEGIVSALPDGDERRDVLLAAAIAHRKVGLEYVFSGHFEGEHWLASFAIYLVTQAGISQ
ncbi:MAG: hypothetical protein COA70_10840 [Planctomycetota bacterium]|nr:MAG: hypothetical protein COA70_10840 [Planctomycetota bacterium]